MALTLHPRTKAARRADERAVRLNRSNEVTARGPVDPALTVIGTAAAAVPQSLHRAHGSTPARRA